MKINSLEISNIRGIPHWQHDFDGNNAVILGANGTGKSSILDAIDFLLTGDIFRLRGEGTGNISLRQHGVHVDRTGQLAKCFVKASVELQGHNKPISIMRSLSDPETLVCCENARPDLEIACRLAGQRQHLLQRQQMLNFVTATPNGRASQVQSLLDIDSVERTRKNLQSVTNECSRQLNNRLDELRRSESHVTAIFDLEESEDVTLLDAINRTRENAGLPHISKLVPDRIKGGISPAGQSEVSERSPTILLEKVTQVAEKISVSNLARVAKLEHDLREKIAIIRSDGLLLRSLNNLELIRRGIQLIDSDVCPLCDTEWNQKELQGYLQSKIDRAAKAKGVLEEIDSLSQDLNRHVYDLLARIPTDSAELGFFSGYQVGVLNTWRQQLDKLSKILLDSLTLYPATEMPAAQVAKLFVNEQVRDVLVKSRDILQSRVDENESQDECFDSAIEKLTIVASRWPEVLENRENLKVARTAHYRSAKLLDAYINGRDSVLAEIYDEVSDDFARLYRTLHHSDEEAFSSQFLPRKAALLWEVEFHGRGKYPPNALHSEGHQDSMGLCMFIVLSERLSGQDLQFMLLDDVVSSVDSGHRRELARLLKQHVPNRQIILTTHDRDWTKMLFAERFAKHPNLIRLDRWDIDAGVIDSSFRPDWDLMEDHLRNQQLVEAASILRNWAERFFKQVCHELKAPVPFDIGGRYTLDDVMSPGLKRYKDLVTRGMKNARKNGNNELLANLESLNEQLAKIRDAFDKELWLINRTIHDNEGVDPNSNEIRNAVRAIQEFCRLINCENCSSMLQYSQHEKIVHCKCGRILWAAQR